MWNHQRRWFLPFNKIPINFHLINSSKLNKKIFSEEVKNVILEQLKGDKKISFLVGAGLSAESGIPTFRGKHGFWTSGSKNYTPQEIGTKRMFDINPYEVWRWFLYRISICNEAEPNLGHIELSKIEQLLPTRFHLISQNVDGLHFEPESLINTVYLIHGDLRFMRCGEECTKQIFKIPQELVDKKRTRETPITSEEIELLKCPNCNSNTRPHVLWFDESYNEHYYHFNTVLQTSIETGLLFVIGTSGATTLPQRVVDNTIDWKGIVIDINPNENLFSERLKKIKNGYIVTATSSDALTELRKIITQSL